MKKIFERIPEILSYLCYTVLLLIYLLGVSHCFKKHSKVEGVVSIIAFPFGLYRGAEFFWHKK